MERKTKTKNKINKKKELPENKHGKKTKKGISAQYRRNKNETFEEEKKLMVGKNKNITKTQEENGRESNLMEKKRKHIKHRKHIVRDVRRTW